MGDCIEFADVSYVFRLLTHRCFSLRRGGGGRTNAFAALKLHWINTRAVVLVGLLAVSAGRGCR